MRTNTDMTVYNKYVDATTRKEKWQRTQIEAVQWENRKAANVVQSGLLEADQAVIYIPFGRGADYVQPKAWQALVSKIGKWTLQVGDVIVKGLTDKEIHEEIPAVIDPPTPAIPAYTMTNLRADCEDVLVITSVDTQDFGSAGMRHWQVGAK